MVFLLGDATALTSSVWPWSTPVRRYSLVMMAGDEAETLHRLLLVVNDFESSREIALKVVDGLSRVVFRH